MSEPSPLPPGRREEIEEMRSEGFDAGGKSD